VANITDTATGISAVAAQPNMRWRLEIVGSPITRLDWPIHIIVATLLTILAVPATFAAWFRVRLPVATPADLSGARASSD
jgi:hypothetical protein